MKWSHLVCHTYTFFFFFLDFKLPWEGGGRLGTEAGAEEEEVDDLKNRQSHILNFRGILN